MDVSFVAAIPQRLSSAKRNFCAKHGIEDDLTLGFDLRDAVAHQQRKTVECSSWNVLGSHSAERNLFGLVQQDAWCVLVQLRFQHWSNTEATLTPTEACVGSAKCLELTTEQDHFCGCGCGGRFTLDATVDFLSWSMRCLLVASWPPARHDKAQWLGTDTAPAARGRKKDALGCHTLQV